MNISFVLGNNSNQLSGGYKVIFQYANYLQNHGNSVTIIFLADRTLTVLPNYIPVSVKKAYAKIKNLFIPTWFPLNKDIKKEVVFFKEEIPDADIIIATAVRTAKPVSDLKFYHGKKFYFIQGFENWNQPDAYVYNTYKLGLRNIVISQWLKDKVDLYSKEKSRLIPNGIDLDIFKMDTPISERYSHSIVFHYREQECKGCEYAIKAIEILEKKYSDLRVTAIGIKKKKPNNIPASCTYVHTLSSEKISELNNQAVVFLSSSIEEGFGLPGLEAMACGCALVSSRFKGVLEYAEDEKNALLVPVKNGEALADAVVKIFENENVRENLIKNGLLTVKNRAIEICAEKFMVELSN